MDRSVLWFARCAFAALLLLSGLAWRDAARSTPAPGLKWYKGNLHTHTINSDGDSAPDAVARWYKERRYHFLALTDHNYFTDPQGLNAFMAATDRFLLMTGEEVTSRYEGKAIHVNAFGLKQVIQPAFGSSVLDTLQKNVDVIRQAGALASLNHPNFIWSVTADDMSRVENLRFFEVYNGHPTTNDFGGGGRPSLDEMWDVALTADKQMWGIAVDDAHAFKTISPTESNPGRGWVQVLAPELSEAAILQSLDQGLFYASTGVELTDLERSTQGLKLVIKQQGIEEFRTRLIGKGGKVLAEETGLEVAYRLQPGDGYVRAKIEDSNGRYAWTQPVFEGR